MTCPNPCPCPYHAAAQEREKRRGPRDRAAYMREWRRRKNKDKAKKGEKR